MADINNIQSLEDLIEVINEYLKTPKRPGLTGNEMNIILKKMVEFVNPVRIREAPVLANEAAAVSAGLPSYKIYITPTGEIRYKLPTGEDDYVTEGYFNDGYTN